MLSASNRECNAEAIPLVDGLPCRLQELRSGYMRNSVGIRQNADFTIDHRLHARFRSRAVHFAPAAFSRCPPN